MIGYMLNNASYQSDFFREYVHYLMIVFVAIFLIYMFVKSKDNKLVSYFKTLTKIMFFGILLCAVILIFVQVPSPEYSKLDDVKKEVLQDKEVDKNSEILFIGEKFKEPKDIINSLRYIKVEGKDIYYRLTLKDNNYQVSKLNESEVAKLDLDVKSTEEIFPSNHKFPEDFLRFSIYGLIYFYVYRKESSKEPIKKVTKL